MRTEDGGYPWLYVRAACDGRKEKLACLLDLVLRLVVMLNSFTLFSPHCGQFLHSR